MLVFGDGGVWRGALHSQGTEDKGGGSHQCPRIRNGVMSLGGSLVAAAPQGWGMGISRGRTWGVGLGHGVC